MIGMFASLIVLFVLSFLMVAQDMTEEEMYGPDWSLDTLDGLG